MIGSYTSFSQTTRKKLEISKEALILIKKDLEICDSLSVAYEAQTKNFNLLIKTNLSLFNNIENLNKKSDFWKDQIKKQEAEIVKLQKRKKDRLLWLGAGALGGLIIGVIISN